MEENVKDGMDEELRADSQRWHGKQLIC
jgi:hypothetical protein